MRPEDLFAGYPDALAIVDRVRSLLASDAGIAALEIRTTRSQVAFRRGRGFAYVWRPGQYLARPGAAAVLSIALDRPLASERFKQVVHPSRTVWMHHLELDGPDDIDDEVVGWLREAAGAAG